MSKSVRREGYTRKVELAEARNGRSARLIRHPSPEEYGGADNQDGVDFAAEREFEAASLLEHAFRD